MRLASYVSLWLIACLLTGCGGGQRFDASSKEASKASMERMTAGMTEDQKKQFSADCMTIVMPDMMKKAFQGAFRKEGPAGPAEADVFRPLNGLTSDEIHAKAEEVRKGLPKR